MTNPVVQFETAEPDLVPLYSEIARRMRQLWHSNPHELTSTEALDLLGVLIPITDRLEVEQHA